MTSRFILLTSVATLLAACDRPASNVDALREADRERQRQAEQVASDRIRQLEDRLSEADQQKAAEREAELASAKEELERLRAEGAAAPEPVAEGTAIQTSDDTYIEEESEPVSEGRVVPETQRVTSVETFYDQLEDEGEWLESDDYGYVFQPKVAVSNRDWRPYTDGQWVYTDYGWTWKSNEDHGWATYHYGRWARVSGSGWVWVPGKEWAPAWVSWRRGGDHCGWAPLPPETRTKVSFTASVDRDYDLGPAAYVFVSLGNFGARSYASVIERPERNVTIINKTVNITNITYNQRGADTVVFNGGPRYDTIRGRSREPIQRVNMNFAPQNTVVENTNVNTTTVNKTVNNVNINKTKIVNVQQGDTLQIAAPPAARVRANSAPNRVERKLGKAKRETGWENVDAGQTQQLKKEMVATSVDRKNRPRRAKAEGATEVAAPAMTERPRRENAEAIPAATPPAANERPPRPNAEVPPATPAPDRPRRANAEAAPQPTPAVTPEAPQRRRPADAPAEREPAPARVRAEKAAPPVPAPAPEAMPAERKRPRVIEPTASAPTAPPAATPAPLPDVPPAREARPPSPNAEKPDRPRRPEGAQGRPENPNTDPRPARQPAAPGEAARPADDSPRPGNPRGNGPGANRPPAQPGGGLTEAERAARREARTERTQPNSAAPQPGGLTDAERAARREARAERAQPNPGEAQSGAGAGDNPRPGQAKRRAAAAAAGDATPAPGSSEELEKKRNKRQEQKAAAAQ